jgi:glucose/arabinose dehydrogenase
MNHENDKQSQKDRPEDFGLSRRCVLGAMGTMSAGAVGLSAFTESAAAKPTSIEGVRIETVATNLDVPWGAAFRNGTLYVTERPGRIVKIDDSKREVIADYTAETVEGEKEGATSGLLGLIVHPSNDAIAYTYQTYRRPDGVINNRVLTHDIEDGFAYEVLFDGIPGSHWQNGGRLAIKGDALHISVGQASRPGDPQPSARNPHTLNGSTLRLTLDGNPYPTNPFADGEEGHPAVFTYGHRNPQGLAFRHTGRLFETEHGPSHDDEINLLEAGTDYGWPTVMGPSDDESITDPLTTYTPTVALSGATFYYGPISQWRDSFFFATLKDKTLYRLRFNTSDIPAVIEQEKLLDGEYGLLRSTFVGPNGNLYVTTSNRDGSSDAESGSKSDRILKIVPDESDDNGPFDDDFPFGENNPFDDDFPFGENNPFDDDGEKDGTDFD